MNQDETTLETVFDIGDVDGYTAPPEDEYPILESSRFVPIPGTRKSELKPRYLWKITNRGQAGENRFKQKALITRVSSVYPSAYINSPKRRVSLSVDIPHFPKKEDIRTAVLEDSNIMESDKETRIAAKIRGNEIAKRQAAELAKAVIGSDDVKALVLFMQSENAEGTLFAAAISVREWCGTCKKGVAKKMMPDLSRFCQCDESMRQSRYNNEFWKFYPAAESTEPLPE